MEGAFEQTVMSNRTCVQVCNAIAHEVGTTPDAGRFRVLRECGLNSLKALPVLGPRSDVDELLAARARVVPQEAQHDGHVFGLDVHDRFAVCDYAGRHDSREHRFDALQDLLCRGECWRFRCGRRRRCAEGTADDGH